MIFVNFKTYRQGSGAAAVKLVEICQKVQKSSKVKIIPVLQVVDLWHAKNHFPGLEVWVQHVDSQPQGKYTGFVNLGAVVEAGAGGTLLNHSEHQIPPGTVNQVVKRVKGLKKANFATMVCCKTLGQARRLVKFEPDFLVYEPPELIASKEKSVASEKPKVIKKIALLASPIPLIVGAGINTGQDVKISLKMGAKGVLVSSGVVLAKEPQKALSDLAKAFKNK